MTNLTLVFVVVWGGGRSVLSACGMQSSVLGSMQMGVTSGSRSPSLEDFIRAVLLRTGRDSGTGSQEECESSLAWGESVNLPGHLGSLRPGAQLCCYKGPE